MLRVIALTATLVIVHPAACGAAEQLPPGGKLSAGERLTSPNGHFRLIMQGDGNLVLYQSNTPLWASDTCGTVATFCIMQTDGNLVVYGTREGEQKAVWSSDTCGCSGGRLLCQDDGNLVIYQDGKAVWSSGTSERGQALLKVVVAFKLIIEGPAEPGKPKPNPKPSAPRPLTSTPGAPIPKPPTAVPSAPSSWRLLRYGKWFVRIGGKLVPYVGWAMLAYDGGVLLYDRGEWLYGELAGGSEKPDSDKGVIAATATNPAEWEAMTPILTGPDTVALVFHTGFLCADVGVDKVLANRQQIGEWEKFRVTKHEDGTISLLALATGKYLSVASGGGAGLTSGVEKIGPWEKFTAEVIEDKLYLKASGGQYLTARKP